MTKFSSEKLETGDAAFLRFLISASENWQREECAVEDLQSYLFSYAMYNGEWRIWSRDLKKVAVSYVLEWSPSNEKPWVGTILVHPSYRMKGIGRGILTEIGEDLRRKGHKALFAGCPVNQDSWLQFLGRCGFDQFKVEMDEVTKKEFMITVKPLK